MLNSILGRVVNLGDRIPVSFHKVKAHTGVIGNERADVLAKNSCEEPENATVRGGSKGTPKRAWVTFDGGKPVSGHHGVTEGTRKHRQKAMQENEKINASHMVDVL